MKRSILFLTIITLVIPSATVFARQSAFKGLAQEDENYFEPPLCLPGMPLDGTCLPYGPAKVVQEMEEAGFLYPPRDLPASQPASELNELPVYIAKINMPEDEPAPIYGSFEEAVAGANPVDEIAPGAMRYISYATIAYHGDKAYELLASGAGWMRASPIAYTDFQGLTFFENPRNDFGWIIDRTPSFAEPSFSAMETRKTYYREDVIQIYQTLETEGVTWFQIAPEEWVNSQKARRVAVNTNSPEGVDANRWIEINLLEQTLSVYEDGRLLFATLVATGSEPFYTQPGVFEIYEKKPLETMQGAFEADRSDFYYLQDVPWTMYFDQKRALHATYWHTLFGYPQSHGCVNLSPGDANWLYQWAEEGETVWVHDPSGQTPTDPDYYGEGAP
ncbi:MAG: L,D-transpeptidase [Chloroflexota bacterium]|jgi:lipoprotein-anchoring transpeptidase ErfK/SrfK|nr:L,D-transpeptidase [Chloroflexota bacterium]